ncbi:Ig-like domain-containing protein [Aeromonas rivipollensis]|uniref:Ig-like domain-containing protein n=1 Tax=Aeromonas rivipollensis TaxID=948519 RepID=UPI0038CF6658
MKLVKCLMIGLAALVLLGCGDDDEGGSTGDGHPLSSLQISPGEARVPVGFEQQFQAQATWEDGSVQDVTQHPDVVWSSSDAAVVTVDEHGLAKGISPGTAVITTTATVNSEPYSATARVEVIDTYVTGLQLTPASATVPVGLSQAFVATASFSDGQSRDVTNASALSWYSSDDSLALVSNEEGSKGLATGLAVGALTLEAVATVNGEPLQASAPLEVTDAVITGLDIHAPEDPLPMGLSAQLHAFATLSDDSDPMEVTEHDALTWHSSDPAVASISETGLVTGLTPGSATIGVSGMINGVSLEAIEPLRVSSAAVIGLEVQSMGSAIAAGLQTQYVATAYLTDGTSFDVTDNALIQWQSNQPGIASVSNQAGSKGLVTGQTVGTATIMASGTLDGTAFTASAPVTVSSAVVTNLEVTPAAASVMVGGKVQYQAMASLSDGSNQEVTDDDAILWSSDAPAIALISNASGSRGEASGLSEGVALISASLGGVTSTAARLSVMPTAPEAPITIEPRQNQLASLQLSPEAFAFWNTTSINSLEGQSALKELTGQVYNQFSDAFDFITVVMNNEEVPPGMPTGEFTHARNDVEGIGLSLFDYTADFHSDGKLQGISFLYKKKYLSTSTYGPILHEMAHRWANWVVPPATGHWAPWLGIVGQLNNASANFADIELYLMGLMESSEMTDPASLAAYALIPADQKPRVPDAASAQKEFRTLLLILSDRSLTATEIQNYNNGATLLARTDNPSQQGTNFHKMTGGRGTLVVSGLDTLIKPAP